MLTFIQEKKNCVGCTACYAICPVHCIKMVTDDEGFQYPIASSECIECNKCKDVCPIYNQHIPLNEMQQIVFAGVTKDNHVWRRSSSGGAYSEICKVWGGGADSIFVGAAWNGFKVHHICVKGYDKIIPLCKSKYIASMMEDVFPTVKNYLENKQKVVFCGTPCQVSGLRMYLNKDYENLFLIDVICHGVGSPDVFIACIKALEKQYKKKISSYEFRAKKRVYETEYLCKITFENNDKKYLIKDPYIQLFLDQKCLRPSCGKNCRYRNEKRQGDITIADFKGIDLLFPKLANGKKNYSSIIFNTNKAVSILKSLQNQMILYSCTINDIKKYNPLFYKQTWFAEDRDDFFKEYRKNSNSAIINWTAPAQSEIESMKHKIYNIMPNCIRKFTMEIYKKVT
jgi:coenzyme F420-reducing hydrogenase beta subunit